MKAMLIALLIVLIGLAGRMECEDEAMYRQQMEQYYGGDGAW